MKYKSFALLILLCVLPALLLSGCGGKNEVSGSVGGRLRGYAGGTLEDQLLGVDGTGGADSEGRLVPGSVKNRRGSIRRVAGGSMGACLDRT